MSEPILDIIEQLVGKPWAPPEFDCWSFLAMVYRDAFGIVLPRLGHIAGELAVDAGFASTEAGSGRWQLVARPELGDAVAMGRGGRPHHCGLWLTGDGIAHCSAPLGVTIAGRRSLQALGWGGFRFYRHKERA